MFENQFYREVGEYLFPRLLFASLEISVFWENISDTYLWRIWRGQSKILGKISQTARNLFEKTNCGTFSFQSDKDLFMIDHDSFHLLRTYVVYQLLPHFCKWFLQNYVIWGLYPHS